MKIKSYNPYYLYQDGVEIDFYLSNDILIESKFFRELNDKQLELFNKYNAKGKIIIDNIEKVINIEKMIIKNFDTFS